MHRASPDAFRFDSRHIIKATTRCVLGRFWAISKKTLDIDCDVDILIVANESRDNTTKKRQPVVAADSHVKTWLRRWVVFLYEHNQASNRQQRSCLKTPGRDWARLPSIGPLGLKHIRRPFSAFIRGFWMHNNNDKRSTGRRSCVLDSRPCTECQC